MAKKSPVALASGRFFSWRRLRNAVSHLRTLAQKIRSLNGRFRVVIIATLLVAAVVVSVALQEKVPWQANGYPHRIPVTITLARGAEASRVFSIVIPQDKLAAVGGSDLRLQAMTADGKKITTIASPQNARSPLVAWLVGDSPLTFGRYFLYLAATDKAANQNEIGEPFLLFDTFKDPWMTEWHTDRITEREAPVSWMAGLLTATRVLTAGDGTGYTIEGLVEETTTAPGGPAIVISGDGTTVTWWRQDKDHFLAQVVSGGSFEKEVGVRTEKDQPVQLRVDVPRKVGSLIRFFVNGQLLVETPLPKEISGSTRLFLLRRKEEGVTYFRWLGVRPYQTNEPEVMFEALEARQAVK